MGKTGKRQNSAWGSEVQPIDDTQHFASNAMYYALLTVPKALRKKTYELLERRVQSYFKIHHGR